MKNIRQKGFGMVEILIVIVVVGLLGTIGWLVYDRQKNNKVDRPQQSSNQVQPTATTEKQTTSTTPSDSWLKYTSQNNKYSLAIPDGWHLESIKGEDDLSAWDTKNISFVAGTRAKVDTVGGGRDGSSIAFSLIYNYKTNEKSGFSDRLKKIKTYTTTNGVTVDKYSRTQTNEPEDRDIPKGTTEFVYRLTHNGVVIHIKHDVLLGETDQTQHIEDAIATLKIL